MSRKIIFVILLFLVVGCTPVAPKPQASATFTAVQTITSMANPSPSATILLTPTITATTISTPIAESTFDAMRVTYIFNAGFLITVGNKRILIDAIYDSSSEGLVKPILESQPPFGGVDLILATHEHVDHFSPSLVRQYLLNNPATVFASTGKAVDQLLALGNDLQDRTISIKIGKGDSQRFELPGIRVEAIFLSHGVAVLNLGYIITIGDVTFFHMGDADPDSVDLEDLQSYMLPAREIDIAFVPWYFFSTSASRQIIKDSIHANYLIPMHFYGKLTLPEGFEDEFPGYFVFSESYESWVLP